jgi:Na+/proline symporter
MPNYTAGLTFFIAVAATNLFHQGNWQRVYAAKNNKVLKNSLLISFIIIIPIVFMMGFSGLIAVSQNSNIIPDLAFFSLLFNGQSIILSVIVIALAIALTVSSIDTLINAISSLIVVDGKRIIKFKGDYLKLSKLIMIFLALITFFIASKGLSVLYLFLLADLFCCAAVLTIFYSFYTKSLNERNAYISVIIGLTAGLLFFPSPNFSQSILVGIIFSSEVFPLFISQSLLFTSFLLATFLPIVTWKIK